ncbi:MAG: 4Fe-4S binding protein, partial [Clostridia bacterium]|nr:4Fe-4S binding protein [Clostridia bacterium]
IKCMRCAAVCPTGARQLDPALLDMLRERLAAVCAVRKENELIL